MNLHENNELFSELITLTAQHFGMREIYVEKDYWLCVILKNLSNTKSEIFDQIVFKGGTALSKAHKLISRFSEDIDLAYITNGLSGNPLKKALKAAEKAIIPQVLEQISNHPQSSKGSSLRKTVYAYPQISQGDFGDAKDVIIVELNAFANPTPYSLKTIESYISEFLATKDAADIIAQYDLQSFDINVLDLNRTLCEKISAIGRASHAGHDQLQAKIRHFYDLYWLMSDPSIKLFVESNNFKAMMDIVISEDAAIAEWADKPIYDAPIYKEPALTMNPLKRYYENTFSSLVYTELPDYEKIIDTFKYLQSKL